MLNSVAKYLWGSSSDPEQGPATEGAAPQSHQQQQQQDVAAVEGEHLAIHQDEDWVVVGLDGQGESTLLETSGLNVESNSEVPMLTDSPRAPSTGPAAQVMVRLNAPAPPSNRPRNGIVHHDVASAKEVMRLTRAAQQLQSSKAHKINTPKRCEHQNKVRDINSHPKGKSNNRRNKRQHASGAKSSRNSQRV